jgi:hypothetical protein
VPTLTLENPVAGTEIEAGLLATNFSDLQTLLNGGLDNSNISASAALDAAARVGVRLNSAGSTFSRRRINFIEGTGIDLTVADDSGNEEVDVTIAATGAFPTYHHADVNPAQALTGSYVDVTGATITLAATGTYLIFTNVLFTSGNVQSSDAILVVDGVTQTGGFFDITNGSGVDSVGGSRTHLVTTAAINKVAKIQARMTSGSSATVASVTMTAIRVA